MLGAAVSNSKPLKKGSDIRSKLIRVAAIVMSNINGVRLCRTGPKIDWIAEIAGRECNYVESKPRARVDKSVLVECLKPADTLALGVIDILSHNQLMVGEKLAQCRRSWTLKVVLIE